MTTAISNNPQLTPTLPLQSVEPRNIWPIHFGNSIIQSFTGQPPECCQYELDSWQVDIGSSWRLLSGNNDIYSSVNQVRQKFIELVHVQKSIEVCFPNQRCLVIVDESNSEESMWRIWQFFVQGISLKQLLLKDLNTRSIKNTAEIFFIVAEKFYSAVKLLAEKQVFLLFDLNNIGIQQGNIVFIGELPKMHDDIAKQSVLEQVKNAFVKPVEVFLAEYQENHTIEVMRFLDVYARGNSESEDLIQVLKSLLKREAI